MEKIEKIIYSIYSYPLVAIFTFMFDCNYLYLLKIFLFLCLVDIFSGFIISIQTEKFNRSKIWKGFLKKFFELLIISISYQMDKTGIFNNIANLQLITIYFYISYEFISITTKALHYIPIPEEFNKIKKGGE